MDVASTAADLELERFIERRADKTPDPDTLEPSYAESVRRYHGRRRDENRWAWIRFYDCLARNHARLAEENAAKAQRLLEGETAA